MTRRRTNNVIPLGQQIPLPAGRYLAADLLVSAGYGPASAAVTVHYQEPTGVVTTCMLSVRADP